jgi:hypothetical protein
LRYVLQRRLPVESIRKQILTDEDGHPVAVQIAYSDWVLLESRLAENTAPVAKGGDLSKHFGVMSLRFDPMEFQQRARSEWP